MSISLRNQKGIYSSVRAIPCMLKCPRASWTLVSTSYTALFDCSQTVSIQSAIHHHDHAHPNQRKHWTYVICHFEDSDNCLVLTHLPSPDPSTSTKSVQPVRSLEVESKDEISRYRANPTCRTPAKTQAAPSYFQPATAVDRFNPVTGHPFYCLCMMSNDPYHSIPSSSSTRFNNVQANTNSARSSLSLMSIPTDEEKWIPSPVSTLASTRSCFGGSLRRRRIVAIGGILLAIIGLGGWYVGGLPDMGVLWDDMGDGMSPSLFAAGQTDDQLSRPLSLKSRKMSPLQASHTYPTMSPYCQT